ncbi:tail fiber assembly protein [Cupriavidus sp. D384]|uniref:tail fiber assembly protein n=1 Tax=Cupriavidus sp. D384 TaxID=1538095 RepID=UPI00082AE90F|nr:tail fiber assembly protein [Cupriavidus sp. D384]
MQLHKYDSQTGQYTGSTLAEPDPCNEDRWLLPAFSTATPLPDRTRYTWPFHVDGAWELRPDYRGIMLYRQDDGSTAEILLAGITPEQAGLTSSPRPSDEYHFIEGEWVINPRVLLEREQETAMAEFDQRMARARKKTAGKADALAAGLLDPVPAALFKAWAAYQMALVTVLDQEFFPASRVWPEEPDEDAVATKAKGTEGEQPAQYPL